MGGRQEIQSDTRVVAATNRNLQESGKFREDLYFRLAVMVVKVPSLRDRGDDTPWVSMRPSLRGTGGNVATR